MPHPSQLLHLPFGQASSLAFDDERSCGEFLSRLPDRPSRFGALDAREPFRARLKNVALPGVSLLAGASSAKATDHQSPRVTIVIPFGRCATVLRSDDGTHSWTAPHHAYFIPSHSAIQAESTQGAFLRLDIVESDLIRTAAGMVGSTPAHAAALDLRRSRVVSMQARGVNWHPMIRGLCGTIDAFDCDAKRLEATGFDDVILRTAVMMLRPELFFEQRWAAAPQRGFDLDLLLEQITANLAGRVTLADMEAWSGRTARTIQMAFRKRFGMAPMQWVRDRRLDLVRARLLASSDGATVREIAAACGMPRMATLIPEYVARFGERPSDTLRGRGG